eukprot:TRINITY_DN37252_c0_g1_i1.p1 TRINITY_DN37252_c0_g1~~TRINITY_DN37252_c0_g1_i1.p1  ORF type:complete len:229 (+),score=39.48 TRINITY_DN37252_c0_g1_i1:56-688(+)
MSYKDDIVDWAIARSRHGAAWWMPILLIAISCLNTLTAGTLVWCVGILQAVLFTIVSMSHGKVGLVLGPVCLCTGTALAAYTYIAMMQRAGADAVLEYTGTADSKFLEKARELAVTWGWSGLLFIQINPLTPVPTAVLVVAGMLVKMDEYVLFTTLVLGKFSMLVLNAVVVHFASEGKSLEECLRELKAKKPDTEGKDDDSKDNDKKKQK